MSALIKHAGRFFIAQGSGLSRATPCSLLGLVAAGPGPAPATPPLQEQVLIFCGRTSFHFRRPTTLRRVQLCTLDESNVTPSQIG